MYLDSTHCGRSNDSNSLVDCHFVERSCLGLWNTFRDDTEDEIDSKKGGICVRTGYHPQQSEARRETKNLQLQEERAIRWYQIERKLAVLTQSF